MKLVAAKCPSCGANIRVDRSLKFTKCEYCDTEIVVEEAVENLLKVELKDTPTLDNYLKLGNRYYLNKEYEESLKAYSKAEEIDPDNPLAVLRKGLSKTMLSTYNKFDVLSAINGLRDSIELMEKMKFSRKEKNESIRETLFVLSASRNFLVEIYQENKLNKNQTTGYIERMESCLNGFVYLEGLVQSNKELEENIINEIIETIDTILGNMNDTKYHLSSAYIKELKNKKKKYEEKIENKSNIKRTVKNTMKEKVVEVETSTSKVKDILCYLMIVFLVIMLLGSIFTNESFLTIMVWVFAIISFIPLIKKKLVQKYGSNLGIVIIIIRIVLILSALIILGSSPVAFENTYHGEDGEEITLKDGKITWNQNEKIIKGEYHWDSKDNDYYIHVQGNNNENYEYHYRTSNEGGSLCLLENNKCSKIYLPIE